MVVCPDSGEQFPTISHSQSVYFYSFSSFHLSSFYLFIVIIFIFVIKINFSLLERDHILILGHYAHYGMVELDSLAMVLMANFLKNSFLNGFNSSGTFILLSFINDIFSNNYLVLLSIHTIGLLSMLSWRMLWPLIKYISFVIKF